MVVTNPLSGALEPYRGFHNLAVTHQIVLPTLGDTISFNDFIEVYGNYDLNWDYDELGNVVNVRYVDIPVVFRKVKQILVEPQFPDSPLPFDDLGERIGADGSLFTGLPRNR